MSGYELGQERYNEQRGRDLRNPQLYPREFLDGYANAEEHHQDAHTEARWESGWTW